MFDPAPSFAGRHRFRATEVPVPPGGHGLDVGVGLRLGTLDPGRAGVEEAPRMNGRAGSALKMM